MSQAPLHRPETTDRTCGKLIRSLHVVTAWHPSACCDPAAFDTGLLVFCVLNVSNPLLHVSKLASNLELQKTKTAAFAAFGLVFFITRVIVFPYVIIKA